MTNNIIVRFPPSPTGFLHIGNSRIALINWLFAKKNKGKIILRFDDTDTERSKEEFKTQMVDDLKFLGIGFDEFYEQSRRNDIYLDVLNKLLSAGFVYKCFDTEEELEIKRKLLLARGKPPIYERVEFSDLQKQNNPPYYRFKLNPDLISWQDIIQGEISFVGTDLSDPVVLRANGNFMYTFCSIVDDFLMNITHIIRGADHITNTAIQIQIFNAIKTVLNAGKDKEIKFAHLPLFQSKEGKISKRVGGYSIMQMKQDGFEAGAINNVLSKIGLSYYDDTFKNMDELIDDFDITNFNKSQIVFDFDLLKAFNEKCIVKMEYKDIKHRLPSFIESGFFEMIKHNISFLHEVEEWFNILHKTDVVFDNSFVSDEKLFLKALFDGVKDLNILSFENIKALCTKNFPQRKGKNLFMPIRLALTGRDSGPEMHILFDNIPLEEVKRRFKIAYS